MMAQSFNLSRHMWRGIFGVVIMIALGLVPMLAGFSHFSDSAWLDSHFHSDNKGGLLIFWIIGSLVIAGGLSRQLVCFAAGYVFGLNWGFLWALLSSLTGCMLAFGFARLIAQSFLRERYSRRVKKFDEFLRNHPFSMTVMIRFLPVGSNLLTNLAAGLSTVSCIPFFLGSLIGYLPQTVIFVLLGSGIRIEAFWRIVAGIALFAISAIIAAWLYRRRRENPLYPHLPKEEKTPPL